MSIEFPNTYEEPVRKEQINRDEIVAPFAEKIIEMLNGEELSNNEDYPSVSPETVKDLIYSFIEQELENTSLYTSEKYGVSFPYTVLNISDFSKKLYSQYSKQSIPETLQKVNDKKRKEFVFQSFINTGSGHVFTFFEEALHQLIKRLPTSLDKIKKGEEPDDEEFYTVGSPTNELGTMSQDFLDGLKNNNAFDKFGELYAEFVESKLPKDSNEREHTNLALFGISIGGSMATKTAEHLIDNEVATQSSEDVEKNHRPQLSVLADSLPGGSESTIKKWQIPIGFAIDAAYAMLTNEYTKSWVKGEPKFTESIVAVLAKRGLLPNMTPEQIKMKNEAIWGKHLLTGDDGIIHNLRAGVPVDEKLKLTEIRGIYDPLQYEDTFRRQTKQKKENNPDVLGSNTHRAGNRRIAAANKLHIAAFMRKNELKRIKTAAKSLESLKV
jgi:hypothetical protein